MCQLCVCGFAGIVVSPFVVQYGCRPTTVVGAVVMVIALALSSLSANMATIYVLQSAIAGSTSYAAF